MEISNRTYKNLTFSTENYRFGFNGKEADGNGEWGSSTHYDYKNRIYDPEKGRFLSVDRLTGSYPMLTPFQFASNSPIWAIDLDGLEAHIVIWNAENSFENAALTRKREIESRKDFDRDREKVYVIHASDLGKLGNQIHKVVKDAEEKGFGKTREVAFYGHFGNDGYVGEVHASEGDIMDRTNSLWDEKQIELENWEKINFNFDESNSIACFYGCQSNTFAAKFLTLSNVKFTAGIDGKAGDSEKPNTFSANWLTFFNEDIYIMDGYPIFLFNKMPDMFLDYKENPMRWNETLRDLLNNSTMTNFSTNVGLDDDGNIYGQKLDSEEKK